MNMYVSNLGFHVTGEEFGQVTSSKVIMDKESGRSRGFGFVEIESEEEARKAMSKLDGKELEGRAISVTVAREKESRSRNF
jgi:RNA recognition motif-containing protein